MSTSFCIIEYSACVLKNWGWEMLRCRYVFSTFEHSARILETWGWRDVKTSILQILAQRLHSGNLWLAKCVDIVKFSLYLFTTFAFWKQGACNTCRHQHVLLRIEHNIFIMEFENAQRSLSGYLVSVICDHVDEHRRLQAVAVQFEEFCRYLKKSEERVLKISACDITCLAAPFRSGGWAVASAADRSVGCDPRWYRQLFDIIEHCIRILEICGLRLLSSTSFSA